MRRPLLRGARRPAAVRREQGARGAAAAAPHEAAAAGARELTPWRVCHFAPCFATLRNGVAAAAAQVCWTVSIARRGGSGTHVRHQDGGAATGRQVSRYGSSSSSSGQWTAAAAAATGQDISGVGSSIGVQRRRWYQAHAGAASAWQRQHGSVSQCAKVAGISEGFHSQEHLLAAGSAHCNYALLHWGWRRRWRGRHYRGLRCVRALWRLMRLRTRHPCVNPHPSSAANASGAGHLGFQLCGVELGCWCCDVLTKRRPQICITP